MPERWFQNTLVDIFNNLSWNIRLLRWFSSVKIFIFVFNIWSYLTGPKEKNWSILFLFLIIKILGWFLNLFRAFPAWSLVTLKSVSKLRPVGIFKFGTKLMKNLLKTSATNWSCQISFWETICSCPSPETTFFPVSVILDFVCTLHANLGFYYLPKCFSICHVTCANIIKEVFYFLA